MVVWVAKRGGLINQRENQLKAMVRIVTKRIACHFNEINGMIKERLPFECVCMCDYKSLIILIIIS